MDAVGCLTTLPAMATIVLGQRTLVSVTLPSRTGTCFVTVCQTGPFCVAALAGAAAATATIAPNNKIQALRCIRVLLAERGQATTRPTLTALDPPRTASRAGRCACVERARYRW